MSGRAIELREEDVMALRREAVKMILAYGDRSFLIVRPDGTKVNVKTFEHFQRLLPDFK